MLSRKEAKAQGLSKYFTGIPCKYGHTSERFVSTKACAECNKIKTTAWRSKNAVKHKQLRAEYYQRNADKLRQIKITNYWKKPEENRAYSAKYLRENPAKAIAYNAKRYASKKQRTPAWLTLVDFERMENEYRLAALQTKITGTIWHVDHIIPLQGKNVCGLHVPTNLKAIPGMDNLRKSNHYGL